MWRHVRGKIASWVAVKDEGGVASEGRVVGVPKFHSWGKCTMPLTNINSDWISNASSGLCINLCYLCYFASWGVTGTTNSYLTCTTNYYRPYPRTIILRLCHSLPDGKLQKERRALFFTAGLLWMMAKGKEYSKDSHDIEAILAHYQVDKPSKRVYQL